MISRIAVVDYGLGNLLSVARAFEHCGVAVTLVDAEKGIDSASHLVLPGVGAFADGINEINDRGLAEPIRRFARSGRPMLGICLGMQLLLTMSEEFGNHEGLGIVPGVVRAVPATGADGNPHKIPHIGWNALERPAHRGTWENSILSGIPDRAPVYFVHSFTAFPDDASHRLADCDYDGRLISAALNVDNVSGCQFHPEKSGNTGLQVLRNFIAMS